MIQAIECVYFLKYSKECEELSINLTLYSSQLKVSIWIFFRTLPYPGVPGPFDVCFADHRGLQVAMLETANFWIRWDV
jgi:hypothetical protein